MEPYRHTVQYYETDRMGITHHSNYIRWMEEARIDFLERIGWGYDKLEREGIVSPVTALDCKYKASTTFAEAGRDGGLRGPFRALLSGSERTDRKDRQAVPGIHRVAAGVSPGQRLRIENLTEEDNGTPWTPRKSCAFSQRTRRS